MTADNALDDILPALRRAGIEVNELGLHLPSLDEVFFTLTGRRASDDESPSNTKEAA